MEIAICLFTMLFLFVVLIALHIWATNRMRRWKEMIAEQDKQRLMGMVDKYNES